MLKQDTILKKDAWKVGSWFGLPFFKNKNKFFVTEAQIMR